MPLAVVCGFVSSVLIGGIVGDGGAGPGAGGESKPRLGGFVLAADVPDTGSSDAIFRRFDHGEAGVQVALPGLFRHASERTVDQITVSKPLEPYGYDFPKIKMGGWRFLDREVRRAIDEALRPERKRPAWEQIVLHGSSSHTGNAAVLESRHRQLGLDSLAYHFVIANGKDAPAGAIAASRRWVEQRPSPSLRASGADVSISVCLIGHFHEERVRDEQLEALDELVRYLRAKLGVIPVKAHRLVESDAAACPGKYLPESVVDRLNR